MSHVLKCFTFVTIAGLSCSSVLAQKRPHAKPCFDKAKFQVELNDCAGKEAKQAEAEMNRVYQELLTKVSTNSIARVKIIASQHAWLSYRDTYLDATYPDRDKQGAYGSWFPMQFDLLVAQLTTAQTKALRQLLENYSDH